MPQNFLYPQRDQPLLLPVDMREWLPEDDLVFVVLDAVATLGLGEFRRRYRADGHGRAAFDPEMMVALLLYGYCQGERSSRVIEKRCVRDVGYRVITGGLHPDHATIARFRARHDSKRGFFPTRAAGDDVWRLRTLAAGQLEQRGLVERKLTRILLEVDSFERAAREPEQQLLPENFSVMRLARERKLPAPKRVAGEHGRDAAGAGRGFRGLRTVSWPTNPFRATLRTAALTCRA